MTKSRDPKLLAQLRSEALIALLEMARWRNSGHASNASVLLARIAGIDEERAWRTSERRQYRRNNEVVTISWITSITIEPDRVQQTYKR